MRQFWRRLPLHMKIFASFGLLLALSMVAVSVYASFIVTQELDQQTMANVERTMQSTAQKVSSELALLSQQTRLLANNHSIQTALKDYDSQTDLEKWERWLRIYTIGETSTQGRRPIEVSLHLPREMLFLRDNITFIPNEQIPEALIAEQGSDLPLWRLRTESGRLSCLMPIQSGWEHLGYVELSIQITQLAEAIDDEAQTGIAQTLLFVDGRTVLGSTEVVSPDVIPTEIGQITTLSFERFQRGGEAMFRAMLPLSGMPFYLVGELPGTLISESGRTMLQSILVAGVVVLMIAFLVAFFLSQSVTRRLRTLADAMGRLSRGDLDVQIAQPATDELGEMLVRFDGMASALKTSHETNERTQRARRESELRLLQAQINPHFIHNTLDSIAWAAKRQDATQVDFLVQNLSGFLRLSLSKTQQLDTLARELQLVSFYFNVQAYRFGGRLTLDLDIQPEAMDVQLPPLLIQPLVENALLHGILKKTDTAGTVSLRAQVIDGLLIVEVQDDGIGMDEETLETLRSQLNNPHEGSYGLWNVHQRARGYAGDEYGLSIESAPGEGMLCLLSIPAS